MKDFQNKIHRREIPIDSESVTTDWLNNTLHSSGTIDSEVTTVKKESLGPGAGYIGQLVRLKLDYLSAGKNTPATLIAKLSSSDPKIRAPLHASGVYETEIRFYQQLAPRIQLPTPRYYYGEIDLKTGHSILLLEDLAAHFRVIDFATGCSLNELELVIQHLAKFHADWWENPILLTTHYLTPHNHRGKYYQERFLEWWSQVPAKLKLLIPDYKLKRDFFELGLRFGPNVNRIFTKMSQHPITLIHKDTHSNNLLFSVSDNKSLMVLDWQMVGYGRGVSDVTHFMIASTPVELRRQVEKNLLQIYHHLLMEHGVRGYNSEECWNDYQLAFFKNLYIVAVLVSFLDTTSCQGKALLQALLPRVVAFSEDHDVKKYL